MLTHASFIVSVALLLMLGAVCTGEAQSGSGIEGVINISPPHGGPMRQDAPASMPLANTSFIARSNDGTETSFETDSDGRFHVALPPGHYAVSRKGPRPSIGNFGPFEVDVAAGKMTKVEWDCDSGLR